MKWPKMRRMEKAKELKKMSRPELLELLLEVTRENEVLKGRIETLTESLASREVLISNAGSIAEASLRLSNVFGAAQEAADTYILSLQKINAESEQLLQKARAEAAQLKNDAERESAALLETARRQAADLNEKSRAESEQLLQKAREEAARTQKKTEEESAAVLETARRQAAEIKESSEKEISDLLRQTREKLGRMIEPKAQSKNRPNGKGDK